MGTEEFVSKSKGLIVDYYSKMLNTSISEDEVFAVNPNKVLKNCKGMFSTTRYGDTHYFEITFNGDENLFYVDSYTKEKNLAYSYNDNTGKLSPVNQLDDRYEGYFGFDKAIEFIKLGMKVARKDWGGYWYLSKNTGVMPDVTDNDETDTTMILAKLKNGSYRPAVPYDDDLLAEDWKVVK